jgi:diadenosine tetraphosphate (Ap4A) HIT family hydrolase
VLAENAVPRRHVADFFEMTAVAQAAVLELLQSVHRLVRERPPVNHACMFMCI